MNNDLLETVITALRWGEEINQRSPNPNSNSEQAITFPLCERQRNARGRWSQIQGCACCFFVDCNFLRAPGDHNPTSALHLGPHAEALLPMPRTTLRPISKAEHALPQTHTGSAPRSPRQSRGPDAVLRDPRWPRLSREDCCRRLKPWGKILGWWWGTRSPKIQDGGAGRRDAPSRLRSRSCSTGRRRRRAQAQG